jgi:uncharacterized protein
MAADPDCVACVFAKAPVAGMVKTRLAPLLGAQGAADFHAQCISRALAVATEANIGPVELCCAPDRSDPFFVACAREHHVALTQQAEGDLGWRMHSAIRAGLARHRGVLVIGTDCPALGPADLREAAAALDAGADAAIAPAEDGGYVMIAARRSDPVLFANVAWSTASVMSETRANLRTLGWSWRELATQWDVDRPEDYRRLLRTLPGWIEGALAPAAGGRAS